MHCPIWQDMKGARLVPLATIAFNFTQWLAITKSWRLDRKFHPKTSADMYCDYDKSQSKLSYAYSGFWRMNDRRVGLPSALGGMRKAKVLEPTQPHTILQPRNL